MHRRVEAAKHVTPAQLGVEIAPYHDGLVPRRLGYRCLILDVFDTQTLKARAASDPYIDQTRLSDIEDVDLVGTAGALAELIEARGLTGQLDYVVSSHNFEHLPDPIAFLRGCAKVLKPGGVVSMVLPDRRVSFDHFRPHSTTADLIEAHFEQRKAPTPKQVFVHESLQCHYVENGRSNVAFALHHPIENVQPWRSLEEGWRQWSAARTDPDPTYRDVHCWAFSPAALELAVRDLDWLKLIDLEVVEVTDLRHHEFFIHLRKPLHGRARVPADQFYARRKELLFAANREAGDCSFPRNDVEARAAQQRAADQQQIAQLEGWVADGRAERARSQQRIAELEARLAQLEASGSWKVTRPLRVASQMLRRFTLNPEAQVEYDRLRKGSGR